MGNLDLERSLQYGHRLRDTRDPKRRGKTALSTKTVDFGTGFIPAICRC
jgi:hypothetical protein